MSSSVLLVSLPWLYAFEAKFNQEPSQLAALGESRPDHNDFTRAKDVHVFPIGLLLIGVTAFLSEEARNKIRLATTNEDRPHNTLTQAPHSADHGKDPSQWRRSRRGRHRSAHGKVGS
jgi:hypothetical protein